MGEKGNGGGSGGGVGDGGGGGVCDGGDCGDGVCVYDPSLLLLCLLWVDPSNCTTKLFGFASRKYVLRGCVTGGRVSLAATCNPRYFPE